MSIKMVPEEFLDIPHNLSQGEYRHVRSARDGHRDGHRDDDTTGSQLMEMLGVSCTKLS